MRARSKVLLKNVFNIRNIGKIRKYLDEDSCKMLVSNLIISHLDYCNALYHGLPDCLLNQLQRVQNTAARLVLCIRKSAHITPVLMKLLWLPVQHRVKFKILMQVYKILNGQSPLYLVDLISRHVPTRAIRSRDTNLLAVPRSSSKFDDRRFSNCNCNYILFTKLPWPGDSEGTFRSSSQAATCPPVYHTWRRLHTVPLIAERQAGKL